MPPSKIAAKKTKPTIKVSKPKTAPATEGLTAAEFIEILQTYQSDAELKKIQRYFKSGEGEYGEGDIFMGVKMGQLFQLAKEFIKMPIAEIEKLLESDIHEVRAGALSIMDKQARDNKIPESQRKALYDLYIKRHDRINNWDLVDLAAIHVVGRYLQDKPRKILYKLAKSKNVWERRTAIVSTAYFLKQKDAADTFAIAEILVNDTHDMVNKPVGGWIRQAGKGHKQLLLQFLDKHAATMPRTTLRYALEHATPAEKKHYMGLKDKA